MSEAAPEVTPESPRPSGNVFLRKIGPMPMWGWLGVGLAIALAYAYWRKQQAAATTAAAATPTPDTSQSDIPQFVNQVYTNNMPPVPGPAGPPGPIGKTGPTAPVAQAKEYPAPQALSFKALSGTAVQLTWDYITSVTPKPTSYTIAAYTSAGKLVSQTTVDAPDTAGGKATATVSGLPSKQKLSYHVWANGGKVAPPHASVTGTD